MGVKEEKARQSCSCFTKTGREMAPVKPSRCSAVWGDLQSFHKRIAKSEAEIAALKKATDAFIHSTDKTLSSPLPSDYIQDANNNVERVPGTGNPVIASGMLPRSKSMELKEQVLDPLTRWQSEHVRLKSRMNDLDKQRLRLDEARRKYYKATSRHIKENVLKQDNVLASSAGLEENPELTTQRGLYQKTEEEVHGELVAHATNAASVQGYLTTAMQLQAARLNEAAAAHSTPAPMGQSTGAMGGQSFSSVGGQGSPTMGGQASPGLGGQASPGMHAQSGPTVEQQISGLGQPTTASAM